MSNSMVRKDASFDANLKNIMDGLAAETAEVEVTIRYGAPVYRAMTGLENERGERVEQGAILPPAFVPDAQIAIWSANRDIVVAFDDDSAHEDEQP